MAAWRPPGTAAVPGHDSRRLSRQSLASRGMSPLEEKRTFHGSANRSLLTHSRHERLGVAAMQRDAWTPFLR